jgi:energy-converting hydrogenase B subunit Q
VVGERQAPELALTIVAEDRPGTLANLTRVVKEHGANIAYVDIFDRHKGRARILFEFEDVADADALAKALGDLDEVVEVVAEPTMQKIFGQRVIVIGGGAQVASVVSGAVSEADRHNIRGQRISVDTIPLVGEHEIAEAVRATGRLPRVEALVLAGSLMGGEISDAVREVKARGIMVVTLNMPGSVRKEADVVVTDPTQAGVMAVMLVAKTAALDIEKIRGGSF